MTGIAGKLSPWLHRRGIVRCTSSSGSSVPDSSVVMRYQGWAWIPGTVVGYFADAHFAEIYPQRTAAGYVRARMTRTGVTITGTRKRGWHVWYGPSNEGGA